MTIPQIPLMEKRSSWNNIEDRFPDYLQGNGIKWNFTKLLIDRNGKVVKRYESPVEPEQIVSDIEKVL